MNIYIIETITDDVVKAFSSLIPQLSTSCDVPTKKNLETIVNSENTVLVVAEENKEILGTLTLVFNVIPTGEKVWIEDVVVNKSARGKGVGKKLVQFAIDYTVNKGISKINLTSSPERIAANKLYQKLNFKSRETNVYRLTIE